jgi:hypothetical protein
MEIFLVIISLVSNNLGGPTQMYSHNVYRNCSKSSVIQKELYTYISGHSSKIYLVMNSTQAYRTYQCISYLITTYFYKYVITITNFKLSQKFDIGRYVIRMSLVYFFLKNNPMVWKIWNLGAIIQKDLCLILLSIISLS